MQSDEERILSNLNVLSAVSHNDKIMTSYRIHLQFEYHFFHTSIS